MVPRRIQIVCSGRFEIEHSNVLKDIDGPFQKERTNLNCINLNFKSSVGYERG